MTPEAALTAHPYRWPALAVLVAGQFMFVVDVFIVNVAIPLIRANLHATGPEIEAVIAVYQIAYAAMLITGGRLGDIFGPKPLFLVGLAGFTLASAWCGLAHDAVALIIARAAQGTAAGLMVPQVLASIQVLFGPQERARAFDIFGIALGLGGAVGLVLGGWMVSVDLFGLSWRMAFLVNVPVGVVTAVAASSLVPTIKPPGTARLDLGGAALLAAGILPLLGTILFGRELGWPLWLAIPALVGILFLVAFVRLEAHLGRHDRSPLVHLAWLRDRAFATGLAGTFAAYAGITGFLLVLTIYLQTGLGYSPFGAGLTTGPLALAFLGASRLATCAKPQHGPCVVMAGAAIMGASLLLIGSLVFAIATPAATILAIPLAIYGFGQGFVLAPLVNTVLARAHAVPAGAASGILVTAQQIAGAVGIALIGLVYFTTLATGTNRLAFALSTVVLAALAAIAVGILGRLRAIR